MRLKDDDRSLIDAAAAMDQRSRSEFMIDAARRAAEERLLSQTAFFLSATRYTQFLKQLDAPPTANKKLRTTMATRAPWEPK
jgi:uncharacterized protein (DUF1778 family)